MEVLLLIVLLLIILMSFRLIQHFSDVVIICILSNYLISICYVERMSDFLITLQYYFLK